MVNAIEIDDPSDPRLHDYIGLRDMDLRRLAEQAGEGPGFFIAEGELVIRRLLASAHPLRSMLLTHSRYRKLSDVLAGRDVTVFVASPEVLNAATGFNLHRGAVASAERMAEPALDRVLARSRLVTVLEGLNDQENLGAIFRSAAALGIDAVLLDPSCADPYYRRTVRVSMGAVLALPFVRLADWPAALGRVREAGFRVMALSPAASAIPMAEASAGPGDRVAILVGAEGPGLSEGALEAADQAVRIPMAPGFDALNVGHAAAIAFHHFAAR